jgi:hypothetical protein
MEFMPCRKDRGRFGPARGESGDYVGDDPVLQGFHPVLEGQLLLLHALDLQRIAAGLDHGVDRGIEIGVFLLELGVFQANFGLFLVRHGYRLQGFGRLNANPGPGPEALTTGAEPLSHFRQPGNAASVSIDF